MVLGSKWSSRRVCTQVQSGNPIAWMSETNMDSNYKIWMSEAIIVSSLDVKQNTFLPMEGVDSYKQKIQETLEEESIRHNI